MSDKPNQNSSGDESPKQDPRLSDTWVPENGKKPAPKSQDPVAEQTIVGPPSNEPAEFDGDMTFVATPAMSEADSDPNDESSDDMNATFVGNINQADEHDSDEPEVISSQNIDDNAMATIVGPIAPDDDKADEVETNGDETDDEAKEILNSDLTFVPPSADKNADEETPFSATVGGMSSEDAVRGEEAIEDDNDPNNFATIVPSGDKERGTDGDPFTATIVGQVPDASDADDRDENRTADLPPRPAKAASEATPNLTRGANGDRTLQKAAPQRRRDDKPQPSTSPASADMDATFVSDSSDGSERPRDKMEQTAGLSGSGSKGPEGSQTGQNIKSNIWVGQNHTSVDELISIRRRPVAGTGQFAVEEGIDTTEADFEIIEKLAEGGMGVVYVAKQKSLNRELAIKTLKGSGGSTLGTMRKSSSGKQMSRAERQKREMFLSEALVTANLVHPNIIPIHELAETADGMPYYVMKRVHGIPWNKRIREMSLQENLDVLHKACDAIAYAHHHGVINRDLKPENIMLGEFGEVLVLDWGLAVPAPHAAEQNFRSPVASFGAGTPAYMSPELWTGPPEAIGECSDIYLLGAILFEIVTGSPPHEFPKVDSRAGRSDLWQTIDSVLRINKIREVSESGELLDIAMKALRTNPDERFGSVLEFQFAVRNYQRHEESRRLSARAAELVGEKAETASLSAYHTYQTAAALFEESLRTWPQNTLARNGLRSTRLRYAQLASQKGDYDLGLQVTAQEPADAEFVALSKKLSQAKTIRSSVKWTAIAAMLLVVALGAKSIYDNGIITNLNAEVTARKAEATEAIADARNAKAEAETAVAQAETAKLEATKAEEQASVAQREAEQSRMVAAKSNEEALAAREAAMKSQQAAEKSRMDAAVAVAQAEEATKKVAEANVQLAAAEKSEAEARDRQAQAETAAKVAQVEIQSQAIRGLTLNENYSDALRQIDRLLDGELLPQLPDDIRAQRTVELNAQREQLLKRTRRSDQPIQSQAVSPDGRQLAFGDSAGLVSVLQNPATSAAWGDEPASSIMLNEPISAVRFVNDQSLMIAAGKNLHLWTIGEATSVTLPGHESTIQGADVSGGRIISGDEAGRILIWNIEARKVIADMTVKSSIRDVAWIPGTDDFIYAGTRGGQSADILAYRLAASSDGTSERPSRPERLGQLELSRSHNDAPLRLSVSPDGQMLAISNNNNGDMVALNRIAKDQSREFPFENPAVLERAGKMTWLLNKHARPVQGMCWSQDSQHLLSASDDRSVGVWDRNQTNGEASELKFRIQLRGHGARVTQATFVDQGSIHVISSSTDGFSRLWNLETHEQDSQEIRKSFGLAQTAFPHDVRKPRNDIVSQNHRPRLLRAARYQMTALMSEDIGESDRAANNGEVRRLNENSNVHRAPVRSVRFADDGKSLVSGAADGTIAVWDTSSRKPLQITSAANAAETFREGHEFNVSRMEFVNVPKDAANQRVLVTSGFDGSLRFWDMDLASKRLGVQLQVISDVGLLNTFSTSKDGRLLVTTAAESASAKAGDCLVWSLPDLLSTVTPKVAHKLSGMHRAEVTSIAISTDGQKIATGSREGVIVVWQSQNGRVLAKARAHSKNTSVTSLVWLSDGTLISAGLDGQLSRWSLVETVPTEKSAATDFELQNMLRFDRDRTPVEHVSISPDEQQMLVISSETDRREKKTTYEVTVWPTRMDAAQQGQFEHRQSADAIPTVASSSVLSRSPATHVRAERRLSLATVKGQDVRSVTSARWAENGSQVLISTDLGVHMLDASSWRVTRVFSPNHTSAADAQFSGLDQTSGSQTVATFDGTTVSLWNLQAGDLISQFRGPFPVSAVAMSASEADDQVFVAGTSIRVFGGRSATEQFGRPLCHQQNGHDGTVTSVVAGPEGSFAARLGLLVTSGTDGCLKLWRWNQQSSTLEWKKDLAQLASSVSSLAWTGDASRLVAVTEGGQIVFVPIAEDKSTDSGVTIGDLSVSDNPVGTNAVLSACDFNAKGDYIVIGGHMKQTSESVGWVLQLPTDMNGNMTLKTICSFSGHGAGGVSALAFADDSPYLISGGNDGSVILWNWQQPLPADVPVAYEAFRFLGETSATAHTAAVTSIDFNSASRTLASASADTTIALWDLKAFFKPSR